MQASSAVDPRPNATNDASLSGDVDTAISSASGYDAGIASLDGPGSATFDADRATWPSADGAPPPTDAALDAPPSVAPDEPSQADGPQGPEADGGCPGVFCEDFEKGAIDPTVWNVQTSDGQTVTVETAVVAHGRYAAQFHANPNVESYDFIITKNAPAALVGHHYGRAYFNVTPEPPPEHTEFLFAGTAGFPHLKYLEVSGVGAAWQLTYVDLVGGTGESFASGGSLPHATWFCLEWEFNDTPDQATVYVDGGESYSRSTITYDGQSTGLVGGFTDFGFGYYDWHPASYPFDIYYDDIVLDTKRVGCIVEP
ncbi:MAG: hypothetical protein ABSC94_10610 [Polyangiaceae bacterium]